MKRGIWNWYILPLLAGVGIGLPIVLWIDSVISPPTITNTLVGWRVYITQDISEAELRSRLVEAGLIPAEEK